MKGNIKLEKKNCLTMHARGHFWRGFSATCDQLIQFLPRHKDKSTTVLSHCGFILKKYLSFHHTVQCCTINWNM